MPPPNALAAPESQSVTFIELFFDLVFVFAVTQITHHAAHHLDAWSLFGTVVVFWLVWWSWTQFTWALNAADTEHHHVRLGTLVSTGVAFVMAVSIKSAFGDDAICFATAYVVLRVLGLGLYLRVAADDPAQQRGIRTFAIASLPGLALVLIGALAPEGVRPWIWLGVIALDVFAAVLAGRHQDWRLQAGHFAERHGLIVIIALGESLIVAGTGVDFRAGGASLLVAGLLAVVATCLLWWTYFGWAKDAMEHRLARVDPAGEEAMARDAYSLWHFPLICGVVCFAVGLVGIAEAKGANVAPATATTLGVGAALFVVSTALAVHRTSGIVLWPRIALMGVTAALVALAIPPSPVWLLATICAGLVGVVAIEQVRCAATHVQDAPS